jgi:ABC-type amino acid transport substrate-binding protein
MNLRAAYPLALAALVVVLTAGGAATAADTCIALRVGYIDQHRPPFFMGEGEQVPEPPGASVDLMRDAVQAAGFGCPPTLVRLPAARLRVALANGDIDMTPLGEMTSYPASIAVPRDKNGNVDNERAMHNTLIVLVRARDKLPASTQPMEYFKGKVLGVSQGLTSTARLREAGLTIDDGGRDLDRNIEKLRLGRVAGVVVSTVLPAHLKLTLDRYKGAIVQLPLPLLSTRVWLAFNDTYYRAHRPQVDALWTWLDVNRSRLGYTLEKYRKPD